MKCPSFEQIYDMDLDNLLTLKKDIEQNKINFNTIPLNEDDFDLYDANSLTDKDSIINLINSEIKERESTKELLNFFQDLNFENNIENKFLAELNAKAKDNNKNLFEIKNKENISQNKDILDNNKISQKPVKFPAHEDMKSFLNRTKIDPSKLQYKVSSNKFIEKFWSFDKEKKLRKKHSDLSDVSSNLTNFSSKANNSKNSCVKIKNVKGNRSRLFSQKIVIGAIDIKKEKVKKKRKKKRINENNESKKINTLELRRNYKVSDITQFLKKKTSLKPLDVPNNQNKDKNCFNIKSETNSLNIKVFNKNNININKETKINKESKLQENKIINNIIKNENKVNEEENKNNIILERFYFSFEKGSFKEIKSDILLGNLNDVKLNQKANQQNNYDKIFNNIDMKILKNISFIFQGKYNKNNEESSENKIDEKNNNNNFKEEYNKKINEEKEEKLLENHQKSNDQQNEQIPIIDNNIKGQKDEKNKKEISLNIIKENEKNSNIEIAKETEQVEEYEEEEEDDEEIEQNDIKNENKNVYFKELVNKNQAIIQKQIDKSNDLNYVSNPIKQRKLNIDKTKSKESLLQNFNLNKSSKVSKLNSFKNISTPGLTPNPACLSKNSSNPQEFKKYILSSVKPPKIISHYNYIFNKNNQRPKSHLSKIALISPNADINLETKDMVDYSDIYSNFAELFSGYYLTNNYSDQNHFNLTSTVKDLYESFNKLYYYEMNHELIQQKDEMYNDIVRAEAGVIINRIKHAEEKLLKEEDINTNVEKYCLLKKCLELERKNYARENFEEINDMPKSKYKKFFRVVLSRPEIYDIVCYTLYKDNMWTELPHGLSLGQCWNLYWSYCPPNIDFSNLFAFQKVNHLINNRIVHRKDLLHKHIMRVRKLNKKCNEFFDIMPLTFLLSKEYVNFVEEFHKIKDTDDFNIWIVKPVGKSRGKGIFLIDNISDVPLNDTFLVQKYLTNPLLLDEGYKFDMRIYCLVTSVNPLEMFLYKDGFARVSNELYSMDISNMKVHLTNAAIQNRSAKKSKNYEKIYGGSKISLDMLRTKLSRQYNIDFDYLIWPQIKDIIVKVFACCQNDLPYCPSTFEMFGFDVIIDSNYRCWLLEINSSPSLERSNVLDDEIKLPLVKDIINIVDPIDIDKLALLNVLERIIKIKNNTKNKDVYLYSPKIQLNIDLNNIFMGKLPRKYGEVPKDIGRFEMVCPSKESEKIIKMAGGQKFYNNKKEKRK